MEKLIENVHYMGISICVLAVTSLIQSFMLSRVLKHQRQERQEREARAKERADAFRAKWEARLPAANAGQN